MNKNIKSRLIITSSILVAAFLLNPLKSYSEEKSQNNTNNITFKGVPLGATVDEFKKSFPNVTCEQDTVLDEHVICRGKTISYLGEFSSKFMARFVNNSLWFVSVRFLSPDRQALSLRLRDKVQTYFGTPNSDNLEIESETTNKFGASSIWEFDGDRKLLVTRCGDSLSFGGCSDDGAQVELFGRLKKKSDF